MKVVSIKKETDTLYKPVVQFTLEDIRDLPEGMDKEKLSHMKFTINNMHSARGFWFRMGYTITFDGFKKVIENPPSIDKPD